MRSIDCLEHYVFVWSQLKLYILLVRQIKLICIEKFWNKSMNEEYLYCLELVLRCLMIKTDLKLYHVRHGAKINAFKRNVFTLVAVVMSDISFFYSHYTLNYFMFHLYSFRSMFSYSIGKIRFVRICFTHFSILLMGHLLTKCI